MRITRTPYTPNNQRPSPSRAKVSLFNSPHLESCPLNSMASLLEKLNVAFAEDPTIDELLELINDWDSGADVECC